MRLEMQLRIDLCDADSFVQCYTLIAVHFTTVLREHRDNFRKDSLICVALIDCFARIVRFDAAVQPAFRRLRTLVDALGDAASLSIGHCYFCMHFLT